MQMFGATVAERIRTANSVCRSLGEFRTAHYRPYSFPVQRHPFRHLTAQHIVYV